MRSTLSLLCLLGFVVSLVWAAPAPHPIRKRAFQLDRVRNPHYVGHNTPRQLMRAHLKYGVRPPKDLLDRLNAEDAARKAAVIVNSNGIPKTAKTKGHGHGSGSTTGSGSGNASTTGDVGSVANTPTSGDVEYLAPVTIGGQTLNLDFDTGSSDLWVFNTQLSKRQQGGHTLFDPSQSSTFKMLNKASFAISYGDGSSVSGNVGTDTVDIGGATVTQQAVELATTVSSEFVSDVGSDGLLGLAFSSINTVKPTQQKTFFDNVLSDLAEPVFTADLRHGVDGTYEFGAIDNSKFVGNLAFVDVDSASGFWQFSSTKFAVGGAAVQANRGAATDAIADTGTTLLLTGSNIATAYYKGVQGAKNDNSVGGFTVPCDADLPDLQLDVGGVMATIKGADIMFEQVQGNTCFGGLQAIDGDLMIFGDVFFKSNFVVFNAGNSSLGFAAHA